MLFHNVLCVFFLALLAPKIETNAEVEAVSGKPETIFADVIRNISRVNTELEDLINNYEQFKKMHTSQEKFDEKKINYISDPEGGRDNRNKKNIGNNRVSSGTTLKYGTKMIFTEDETEKSSQSETNSKAERNSQSENKSESEKSSQSENNSESEKSSQSEHNNEENQSKEEPTWSMGNTSKKIRKIQKATTKANIVNKSTFERETEKQENIENRNLINMNKEPETIKHINETKEIRQKQMQAKYSGSDSYSESEQVKEEDKGADKHNNRATATEEDGSTAKLIASSVSKYGIVVSSTAKKLLYSQTGLICIQGGKDTDAMLKEFMNFSSTLKKNCCSIHFDRLPKSASTELSDNDEALIKDVFKTNVLRKAYGDACLKVVIRKCYKACKSAVTFSCRAFKCKSDLKSYFIKTAKTVCIEAFNSSMAKKETEDTLRRDGTLNKSASVQYGYLSMACQSETEMPSRRKLTNNTLGQAAGQVNILRDKFERACQRISQKKCQKACKKAREATCEKFECQKRLKTNFKRNCKRNCKRAYSSKSKGSSSDDDSDDGSDASSDDDNDSDSRSSKDSSSKSKS